MLKYTDVLIIGIFPVFCLMILSAFFYEFGLYQWFTEAQVWNAALYAMFGEIILIMAGIMYKMERFVEKEN